MKINKRRVFICIAIPVIVGGVAALLTKNSMEVFQSLNQPPLSPPGWLFPVVWTILYVLMGISSYLILESQVDVSEIQKALRTYGVQLVVNFLWPTFFFNFGWYLFAFGWLLFLLGLVIYMVRCFWKINRWAVYLNIPYLVWLGFAAYLNLGVWILNP